MCKQRAEAFYDRYVKFLGFLRVIGSAYRKAEKFSRAGDIGVLMLRGICPGVSWLLFGGAVFGRGITETHK